MLIFTHVNNVIVLSTTHIHLKGMVVLMALNKEKKKDLMERIGGIYKDGSQVQKVL